ncbi:MAG: signal peptidase I [Rickettsiales bacterium]|jgi:signal peptidase I|nr:signal peptidase I [Rickettsiales bacterium]
MRQPTIIGQKKQKNILMDWVNTIFWAGLIAIIFRSFLLEPFNIPSGSMIPTMEVGDHLFVSKWNFGYSRFSFPFGSWNLWSGRFWRFGKPERGDIIVFRKPNDTIEYVKRLIGIPGDTIQMKSGRLYVNGILVQRKNPKRYIVANVSREYKERGYKYEKYGQELFISGNRIFANGAPVDFNYTIEYKDPDLCRYSPMECMIEEALEYTEILPNGKEHQIVELSDADTFDNTAPFVVPDNHYFMMGDNRDRSADSRSVGLGPVHYDNFMGKVLFIFYSHNYYSPLPFIWDWRGKMRWERFGISVK